MAKFEERSRAIELRKQGKSYSQIKRSIKVSKSTLSIWLQDLPLSERRLREVRDWNQSRIENYRETRRKQREAVLNDIYKIEKRKIMPLTAKEIFIGGLFLYWGEGAKTKLSSEAILSNTNPSIVKAFIHWLEHSFHVRRVDMKIRLQLYKDMDVDEEIHYWSRALLIKESQFRKPYIKKSNRTSLTYKNKYTHGTCNVILGNAKVSKKIMMGLKILEEHFMG
ncbi:MAG: hypothetical protein KGI60_01580 [Patescibacteria group bacterium]|nr:hypothetical protein [Patescibacteria group bacterium]